MDGHGIVFSTPTNHLQMMVMDGHGWSWYCLMVMVLLQGNQNRQQDWSFDDLINTSSLDCGSLRLRCSLTRSHEKQHVAIEKGSWMI